jgi:hypothetical protein
MDTIKPQNKIWTGIGSRQTPVEICKLMTSIASAFSKLGWTCYTGGAEGADQAFIEGCDSSLLKVFLPFEGFRNIKSPYVHDFRSQRGMTAEMSVEVYHPAPRRLGSVARMLMARNAYQISGWNHSPEELTDLVICWTPDCRDSGGTGQAIRIATDLGIPVVNLKDPINVRMYQRFVADVMAFSTSV